ncbi:class C sortase [Lactococcus sp. dk101]|nr:class C sortase [Lactococcus sp. dk101]
MGDVKDPFSSGKEKNKSVTEKYLNSHLIGAIYIPKIDVSLPLYDETNDVLLDEGATVLQGSSFPIGGDGTHSVITGHSGVPEKKLFTDLDKLSKGDKFYIEVEGKKLAYKIVKFKTVLPNQLDSLKIDANLDQVTLVTCTPYMVNTHRLLVTGVRTTYVNNETTSQIKNIKYKHIKQMIIILALIFLIFVIFIWIVVKNCLGHNKAT